MKTNAVEREYEWEVADGEVHDALQKIVDHADKTIAVNYAVNYAKVGLCLHGELLRVQCLYVLGNIEHWRGPVAKEVRNTLKAYVKEN